MNPYPYIITLLAALLLVPTLGGCATVETADPTKEEWPDTPQRPWEELETPKTAAVEGWDESEDASGEVGSSGIFDFGYRFYSSTLTKVDGARCEHRPTCSRFAMEAVRKHGVMVGSFLAVDRLMRGPRSSVIRSLPIYRVYEGTIYYHDPVESNDFFL